MADNAKMHFNIGLILATLEDHERAVRKKNRVGLAYNVKPDSGADQDCSLQDSYCHGPILCSSIFPNGRVPLYPQRHGSSKAGL